MPFETIRVQTDRRGVATVTLDRPAAHNAMSTGMMTEVPEAIAGLEEDASVRAIVLTGAGKSFCAGGDLKWMRSVLSLPTEERLENSRRIANMLGALAALSKPLIGRINGPAYGGGVGLVSVCDVAIASDAAKFGLTEVRLGLIPANIAPYVVARMGGTNAREVFFNGRIFDAEEAQRLQLVNRVVPAGDLDAAIEEEVTPVLACGPEAVAATKRLVAHIGRHGSAASIDYAMAQLAEIWKGDEAREGIMAFLEKRPPAWSRKP